MELHKDHILYGLRLYPFALTIALGVFLTGTGPTLLQSLTAGIRGVTGYRFLLLGGILVFQVLGAVVSVAGFFGALKKVLDDTE